jgi:SAM-dependent methyltransferase
MIRAIKPEPRPQVEPEHYRAGYDTRRRFLSYWNQIDQVRRAAPSSLLEVGVGNGFVSDYLRREGFRIHTVDFDERLGPDTVASVTSLPFDDESFDVTCCFETLEHLAWEHFEPALRELRRVARRRVLVSLPDVTPYLELKFGLGYRANWLTLAFDYPRLFPAAHRFDGQHHWELGKRGYRLRTVRSAFERSGLQIDAIHRDYEDPYHRFFVCSRT